MPTTTVQVDPTDVAVVEALEAPTRALLEAFQAALPAIRRLREAEYPGADMEYTVKGAVTGEGDHSLKWIFEALETFKVGGGDQAACDYHILCEKGGKTVAEAATEIFDEIGKTEAALVRIDALRRYAATVRA